MVKTNIFNRMFLEAMESLSEDDRLEIAELNEAAIAYEELKRDLFIGHIDKRIIELKQEHALWTIDDNASSGGDKRSITEKEVEPVPPYEAEIPKDSEIFEPMASDTEPTCGDAKVGDIASCRGQRDAVRVIGALNPDGFTVGQAAAMIHAAGLSKGSVESVMSNIHSYMSTGEDWEKIGPGRFRFRTANPEIQEVGHLSPRLESEESDSPEQNLEQVA